MFSFHLLGAAVNGAAAGFLDEEFMQESAVVEEHVIQNALQEVDRSLAYFDDCTPTSPVIPGFEHLSPPSGNPPPLLSSLPTPRPSPWSSEGRPLPAQVCGKMVTSTPRRRLLSRSVAVQEELPPRSGESGAGTTGVGPRVQCITSLVTASSSSVVAKPGDVKKSSAARGKSADNSTKTATGFPQGEETFAIPLPSSVTKGRVQRASSSSTVLRSTGGGVSSLVRRSVPPSSLGSETSFASPCKQEETRAGRVARKEARSQRYSRSHSDVHPQAKPSSGSPLAAQSPQRMKEDSQRKKEDSPRMKKDSLQQKGSLENSKSQDQNVDSTKPTEKAAPTDATPENEAGVLASPGLTAETSGSGGSRADEKTKPSSPRAAMLRQSSMPTQQRPPPIISKAHPKSLSFAGDGDRVGHDVDDVCDMLEYAEKFFNDHERDVGGSLMKSWKKRRQTSSCEYLSREEMLRFCKTGQIPTSHLRLHDPHNVHIACNIFKDLTRFIRDELKDDTALSLLRSVIRWGIERVELRDEIYCQLLRQTNGPPDAGGLRQAWVLLCLCVSSFLPSKHLHKYLLCRVEKNVSHPVVGNLAMTCRTYLTSPARTTTRKYPPSAVETASVQQNTDLVIKVYFLDGKSETVSLRPRDTTQDVVERVAGRIGLPSAEDWALCEVFRGHERFIRRGEYVADLLSLWETSDWYSSQLLKHDSVSKRGHKTSLCGSEVKLVYRRRVFRNLPDLSGPSHECHLLYMEAVHKVVKVDEVSTTDKMALQLAGLQAQVLWGSYEDNQEFRYREADQYLCKRILSSAAKDWSQEIARSHKLYGAGKTPPQAKTAYMTFVKQSPLYGCALFPITHKGLWTHAPEAHLAISADGVKFVRGKDKVVVHDLKYSDVTSVSVDANEGWVVVELGSRTSPRSVGVQRAFMFDTEESESMCDLLAKYCPRLAGQLRLELDGMRQLTDEEKLQLYEDIAQCRKTLADSDILQRPLQEGSTGFLRNRLRKLTKKPESQRSFSINDTDNDFGADFWCYSKTPPRQPITVFHDPLLEDMAVKLFTACSLYCSAEESGHAEPFSENTATNIQGLLLKCLESECICNELYLQLVKQTTDHPDGGSAGGGRAWQLLAVTCATVPPPDTCVLSYVQVHLQKCALDLSSSQGKFALFSLKCLMRTVDKKRRKFPPSLREIQCIVQRKSITQRITLLNGDQCLVTFDSAATSSEFIRTIKAKLGMKADAPCFAVYEVVTSTGSSTCRAVGAEERLADIISRWERLSHSATAHDFRLDFKKRLFIEPYMNVNDPVECGLVFHQLIQDVFEERIPVSPSQAAHLCALKIQSEAEDTRGRDINYSSVMRILPRGMRGRVKVEEITAVHGTVKDQGSQQAELSFIRVLQAWSLFGATLFPVTQSYTSSLPKSLQLAVHEHGVSLLERQTFKVLSTFSFSEILQTNATAKNIVIVVAGTDKGNKLTFHSDQASQTAQLVRDYMLELQARYLLTASHTAARTVRTADTRQQQLHGTALRRIE